MKHFRNRQECERKPYFLARSKILFIENNNFTQLRKEYKKREICLHPFFLSFFSLLLFWWLSLVKVSFYKLFQQGDDCVFKDFYATFFYDAQYVSWTDNGRSFHHSARGCQTAKRRVMGHSIEIFTGS